MLPLSSTLYYKRLQLSAKIIAPIKGIMIILMEPNQSGSVG